MLWFAGAALLLILCAGLLILYAELTASRGSTYSELSWLLWARQPWVIYLLSVLGAYLAGFFSGHFVSQSKAVYDARRLEARQETSSRPLPPGVGS